MLSAEDERKRLRMQRERSAFQPDRSTDDGEDRLQYDPQLREAVRSLQGLLDAQASR